jgi:hypothetical protein
MVPDLARTFLADYSGDASLNTACREVNRAYDGILEPYRRYESDEQAALHLSVGTLRAESEDFPSELRSIGVEPDALEKVDVDLDGEAEWVLVIEGNWAYLAYVDGPGYGISVVPAWLASDFDPQTFQVSVEAWQDYPEPLLVVESGENITIVSVKNGFEMIDLFEDFGVRSFKSLVQEASPQFLVYYLEPPSEDVYFHPPMLGYRWDEERDSFEADLLEYSLFTRHDPQQAIQIAHELVPFLDEWKDLGEYSSKLLAYEYYLAGLSYELSGDFEGAAEIYLRLWRRFPGSPYAHMAKFKLEASSR